MAKVIKRQFDTVSFSSAGQEMTESLIGQGYKFHRHSGYLQQIIIRKVNGGASSVDIEIRYESGNSTRENLVYTATNQSLPVANAALNLPFSLGGHGDTFSDDLILYLKPNADATFNIRVDLDLDDK